MAKPKIEMNRTHSLTVVCLLVFSATGAAQSSQVKKPEPVKPVAANTALAKDPEAERLLRERRAQAQSLLISLANDAGTFNDQRLRARTQAHVADLLWETDADRARNLFRKAWDAAEVADAEGQQRMQEEAREQQAKSGGGGYAVSSPPDLRKEVLRLAVKHDPSLGEEFLGKLQEKSKEGSAKDNPIDPREKDPESTQRLEVARELLSSGDKERALEFGSPLLNTISRQAIEFLASLREKNAPLADERYASMLDLAAANPQSDLNIVALLSSYLFTPHAYSNFLGYGALPLSRTFVGSGPPDVAPALRARFFRMASEILMRPIQPGQNQTATNVLYKYTAILAFIPWFEQFATPELTAMLRTQLEALTAMVPESQRRKPEEPARDVAGTPKPPLDREQPLLDRIARAKTSAEQDQLYLQLALLRGEAGNLTAREYGDKIADSELRQAVRRYIDASLAWKAIEKKDVERALETVRTGELTRLQKVWTMARAARLLALAKPNRERALQILDDASAEARRMDDSDPDRPRAFLAVTSALLAIDRPRGWDSMADAVKAANSTPDFTGEDGQLTFRISAKGSRSMHQHGMPEFDVAGVFQSLATEDYERAVALARVFQREAPRANAVMAIALAILNENRR